MRPLFRPVVDAWDETYFQMELDSYDEIAAELELPLGTVKAQLFRAREFISNIMKNIPDNY